ncbi:MAG TPA: phosphotransferase [Acidimicrobiales bacterium]
MTADQLTAALQSTGTLGADARVASFDHEQIGIGIGILALLWRLTPQYEPAGAGPETMVLKLPHTMPESRHIADAFRFYLREVRFYEVVGHRTPIGTADRYYSAWDDATGDFVLVMEDLGDRRMIDQVAGATPDDAELLVESLAAHHAAFWQSPELSTWEWGCRIIDPPNPQALVPALQASWPIIESQFAELLPGPMLDAARRLPDHVVPLMEQLSAPPVTLLHGDSRLDNFFLSDAEGDPPVAAVDWQICGIGRGPYDVAYLLSQSLLPAERKANESALVRHYHDTLVANGVGDYSFDDCWTDYRKATLFVAVYPLNAGSVDLVNDRAVELFRTMLTRSVAAILDLDALEFMG